MALSALGKNVKRLHELTSQVKDLEAERDALKEWFRKKGGEAGGADAVFEQGKLQVAVTAKQRTGWDGDALKEWFRKKGGAGKFKKTTSYVEVSCRLKEVE